MNNQNFSTTITVDQSPEEAFAAINNVRGWWSEEINGSTARLGEEFKYHFKDVHRCTMKITQMVPGKKVAWHVLDNYFSFTKDKTEWKDTDIYFEISKKSSKTEIRFTHQGLTPEYECFNVCSDGWITYINGSLRDLITTGKGHPNVGEAITDGEAALGNHNYTTTFTVDQTPQEVFAAINNVRAWWTGKIDGETDKPGDEFTYRYEDVHRSEQKVTELIPGKKVVWHVVDAALNFTRDKTEWKGTDITFDISKKGNKTQLRFTHVGLVPQFECYESCSNAWGLLINGSLRDLITKGKGTMDQNRIERHIDLNAGPARVWKALTDFKEFGQWFGVKLAGPFVVGKTVTGKMTYPGFEHMQWAVDVKAMEPERLFSFTWHPYAIDVTVDYSKETPTLVEFKLEPTSSGTHLVVTESGFEKIPANRRLEAFRMDEEGWIEQLENIAKYVG